jgi:hypothetical protein
VSVACEHAAWLTLAQAIVCDAIEKVVPIRLSTPENGASSIRLWVGPVEHHTAWFVVAFDGEITATTRGNGERVMRDEIDIDHIDVEAARLLAWVAGDQSAR